MLMCGAWALCRGGMRIVSQPYEIFQRSVFCNWIADAPLFKRLLQSFTRCSIEADFSFVEHDEAVGKRKHVFKFMCQNDHCLMFFFELFQNCTYLLHTGPVKICKRFIKNNQGTVHGKNSRNCKPSFFSAGHHACRSSPFVSKSCLLKCIAHPLSERFFF